MQGGSFLIEWARYRKMGVLEHPEVVVGVVPLNKLEFDFVLEIGAQIALISILNPESLSDHPVVMVLAEHIRTHPAKLILTD